MRSTTPWGCLPPSEQSEHFAVVFAAGQLVAHAVQTDDLGAIRAATAAAVRGENMQVWATRCFVRGAIQVEVDAASASAEDVVL